MNKKSEKVAFVLAMSILIFCTKLEGKVGARLTKAEISKEIHKLRSIARGALIGQGHKFND